MDHIHVKPTIIHIFTICMNHKDIRKYKTIMPNTACTCRDANTIHTSKKIMTSEHPSTLLEDILILHKSSVRKV